MEKTLAELVEELKQALEEFRNDPFYKVLALRPPKIDNGGE